jgi:hypothetical protein
MNAQVEYIWKGPRGLRESSFHCYISWITCCELANWTTSRWQSLSLGQHLRLMPLFAIRLTPSRICETQNRYLIPLSFIVCVWAYYRTSWTQQVSPLQQISFLRKENLNRITLLVVRQILVLSLRRDAHWRSKT